MNKTFWEELTTYGFTSLSGVPFFYEMLNRTGFTQKKFDSIRYMTQAGGKLNESLLRKFAEYAKDNQVLFYTMYGQTEASARMSFLSPDKLIEKLGSIGKPIPNGSFEIDPVTSELIYNGPNVFGGYASGIQDLQSFKKIESLHTGDLARVDEDGYYYITGRIKRIVKIFGSRINLDESEQILKNQFIGDSFACIGIQDKYLFIVTNSRELEYSKVTSFLQSKFEIHPSAIKIVVMDEIPTTPNGKTNYTLLTETYATA
jgi:acyl-CoA synthetase (AMP-forming)/AMP-acid ligase II